MLPDDYARMLFETASPLTPTMRALAREHGIATSENSKAFVLNADMVLLVQAIDIGTRPSHMGMDNSSPVEHEEPAADADEAYRADDFMNVELRVARVLSAERVEGTDKLLKLEIDVGDDKRQIVAGIAHKYAPESLVGKSIVVVANLKPARVRGVESQGMLLAADAGQGPIVATFESDVAPGARVR